MVSEVALGCPGFLEAYMVSDATLGFLVTVDGEVYKKGLVVTLLPPQIVGVSVFDVFASSRLDCRSGETTVIVVQVPEVAIRTTGKVLLPGAVATGVTGCFDRGDVTTGDSDPCAGDGSGDGKMVESESGDEIDDFRRIITCAGDDRDEFALHVITAAAIFETFLSILVSGAPREVASDAEISRVRCLSRRVVLEGDFCTLLSSVSVAGDIQDGKRIWCGLLGDLGVIRPRRSEDGLLFKKSRGRFRTFGTELISEEK